MNHRVAIFLFTIICALTVRLHAQKSSYDLKYFSDKDGLSSQFINSITQDKKGFIWVATNFGLNRFDGEKFESFTKANSNLKKDRVVEITEDVDGKIWAIFQDNPSSNEYSISIFNPLSKKAQDFKDVFPKIPFAEEDISFESFYQDGKNIWFSTIDGSIFKYDGKFHLFAKNDFYKNAKIRKITNEYWLAVKGNLIQLSDEGKEQKRISTLDYEIWDFGKNVAGEIWIAFHNKRVLHNMIQIYSKEDEGKRTIFFPKKDWYPNVYNFQYYIDDNGADRFLFVGGKMLKVFDHQGNEISNLLPLVIEKNPNFFSHKIFQDKKKNFWLNTNSNLLLLSPKKALFNNYLKGVQYSIRGMTEINEDELFVATYNGFFILNKKTANKLIVETDEYHNYGLGLIKVDDEILMGYHGTRFLSYNIQTQEFAYHQQNKGGDISSFYRDENKIIWVLTNKGLLQLDLENKETSFPSDADLNHTVFQKTINHISESEEGLWVATQDGFYLMSNTGEILQHFEQFDAYQINFLYHKSKDNIWLTTQGSGLLNWNRKTNQIKRLTINDGLSHDYLYSIDEDKFGFFWIPSNNGLMRFNPSDFSVSTFKIEDGLTNNEFNTYSRFVDDAGQIYFGSIDGLISFDPADFRFIDDENSLLRILSYFKTTEGKKAIDETKKLNQQQKISFEVNDKFIDLSFSLIDFSSSYKPKYAYQIEGYDETWNLLESNRLRINRLPYGNYQLKIKGQSKYGKWSTQQITLPLLVLKPFYLSTWFLIFASILFAGLIYSLFRYRLYRVEKEKLQLEKIVEKRTKILAEQTQKLKEYNQMKDEFFAIIAHDLRGPVISFQGISKKIKFLHEEGSPKDVDGMLEMVDTAAENLNVLLDNLLNWALLQKGIFPYEPTPLNLKKMSDETVQLFNPMAQIKGVKIEQNISNRINVNADENAMSMVLRNVISNAIKFSSEGDLIKIDASNKNGNVLLQIKDTGVGMPPDVIENVFELHGQKIKRGTRGEKGSGLGLVLCKELLEQNKGSIEVESELEKGTAFSILLPMN